MGATTSAYLPIIFASLLCAFALTRIFISTFAICSEIREITQLLDSEVNKFKLLTDEAWKEAIEISKTIHQSALRKRRQSYYEYAAYFPVLGLRGREYPLYKMPATGCKCRADNRCPAGKRGPKGVSGENGTPGVDGLAGGDGTNSENARRVHGQPSGCFHCPAGAQGVVGLYGRTGLRGMQGARGAAGVTGREGQPGSPGDVGVTGLTGLTGGAGKKGVPGHGAFAIRGSRGRKGVTGQLGAVGEMGESGRNGSTGNTGRPGVGGRPGVSGLAWSGANQGGHGDKGHHGDDAGYCTCPARSAAYAEPPFVGHNKLESA